MVEPPDAILDIFETVEEKVFAPVTAKVTGAADAAIALLPALFKITEIVSFVLKHDGDGRLVKAVKAASLANALTSL